MQRATAAVRLLAGDKEPVRLASTANLALAGLLTVDGVVSVAGDRILVKDQTDATANGIYTASEGTWYRVPDFNSSRGMIAAMKVAVQEGATQAGDVWSLDTNRPNIGEDDIEFSFYLNTNIADYINDARETLVDESAAVIALGLGAGKASQAEAEAGVTNVPWMTPQRTAQAIVAQLRTGINSDLTLYAHPSGSSSNPGTEGSPLPPQDALDIVSGKLVINDKLVKVRLLDSNSYTSLRLRNYVGSVDVNPGNPVGGVPGASFTVPWLCGNPSNFEAVKVDGAGGFGIVGVDCNTPWFITDMRISGNAVGGVTGDAILADFSTKFYLGNIRFGVGAQGARAIWKSQIEFVRGMAVSYYPGCNIGVRTAKGGQILAQLPNGPDFFFLNSSGALSSPGTGPNYPGAFAYSEHEGSHIDLTGVNSWNGFATGVAAAEIDGGDIASPELLPFGSLPSIYYQGFGFAVEGATTAAAGVVAASTWTKITWGATPRNDGGWSRSGKPANSYSPTKAGWYIVTLQLELTAITNGKLFAAAIYINGIPLRQSPIIASGATEEIGTMVSAAVYLDGDTQYLEAYAFHNDAGSQTIDSSVVKTQFFGYRLS